MLWLDDPSTRVVSWAWITFVAAALTITRGVLMPDEPNRHGAGPEDCNCPTCNLERATERGRATEENLRLAREARQRALQALERECPYRHQIDPKARICTVSRDEHYNCLASYPACEWIRQHTATAMAQAGIP